MNGFEIDWFWIIAYLIVGGFTMLYSWSGPCRPLALAIMASIVGTDLAMIRVDPAGLPFVHVLAEIAIMFTAAVMAIYTPRTSVALIVLGMLSCMVSLAYSAHRDIELLLTYETTINGILLVECALVMNWRALSALGYRLRRFSRWYLGRRRASHAARRGGMAAGSLPQSQVIRAIRGVWSRG